MATSTKTTAKSAAAGKAPAKRRAAAKPAASAKPAATVRRQAKSSALNASSALSVGAAILTVGAAIAGFLARRQIAAWVSPETAGHKAADLTPGTPQGTRAPVDFRPDMAAPISAADREALRPATLNSHAGAST